VAGSLPGRRGIRCAGRRPDGEPGRLRRQRHPGHAVRRPARLYQSSASWYDPRTADANFVVTGPADGTADLIPRAEILALAGPPARSYRFDSFTIMVWNENLLTLLASPPSRTPGDIGHL
jgi:hypothetical protein